MSQYIQFFLRNKDNFFPIGTYSRSSVIYEYFQGDVPYEKVAPVTKQMLNDINNWAREKSDELKREMVGCKETIKQIGQFNNTVEEKMEEISSVEDSIEFIEEEINRLTILQHFINFLKNIISEAEDIERYGEAPIILDSAHYIYAGIETGYTITSDMIVGD